MPGVKIGPNATVGPHVCLRDDLESDKTVLLEQAHKTTRNKVELGGESKQDASEMIRGLRCVE